MALHSRSSIGEKGQRSQSRRRGLCIGSTAAQNAGRVADDGIARGYVPDHDRTGTDIRVSADANSWDHAGSSSEESTIIDGDAPGQMNARAESRKICDPIIVRDGRPRIHEDMGAEKCIRRDRRVAEDDRSFTDPAARADQHCRIDDRSEARADGSKALDRPGPSPGLTQCHDEAERVVAGEIVDIPRNWAIMESVGGRDVRVDQTADELDVTTNRMQPWKNDQDLACQSAGSE